MSDISTIRVLDFEMTGFPPGAGVCEVGYTDVRVSDDGVDVGWTISQLCNPGLPIEAKAREVHGITDEMVAGCLPSSLAFKVVMQGADVFCAHNCDFERKFFTGGDRPWICTYKVALARFPGLESYKNGNLPRLLGIYLDPDRCAPLHRAGPDTYVTARILEHFLASGISIAEMVAITARPKTVLVMPFGKHRGVPIADLPESYMRWAVDNLDAEDVRHAVRLALSKKENAQ